MTVIKRARDAVSGRFVSLAYAALHKASTVVETLRKAKS